MTSNTMIQCPSSSSQPLLTKYDVFVSFRGEDTRNTFTAFLLQALSKNGIHVFKDDQHVRKGESIAPELLHAIQGSRLFVVVFSKNYASSTWCLRELVEICNCTEASSRQVLPILYDVDPSEVRKQSGYYGIAFAEHERRWREDKEKMQEVQRWRQALTQVANFSGWDIRNKSQDVIIDEIVKMIKKKLGPKYSSLPKDNLVGMDSHVEELAKLLHSGSNNDVRVVGISGMGGIGKTVLARALCERISHQYDSCCFIEDVNDIFQKFGALGVQKQLLYQSLNEKNPEIYNVSHGTCLVWTRLRHKRTLIVLDNVHNNDQLNIFSGNRETLLRECLGGGSRVIIISRDKKILRTHGVDDLYLVQPLDHEEACQLFCRNAFKRNYIMSGYENLTDKILSYAQGHPLAIKVLGSSLFGENVSQWKSIFARLNDDPSRDIMNVLRIGFDDLGYMDMQIFLDIACFFSGKSQQRVSEILDFRGFHPEVGLEILENKSLISIENGFIIMPNVLKDLGKFIVQEESPKEPRKWSRLWDYQDLQNVMSDNMDKTNIGALVIRYIPKKFDRTTLTVDALSKLRNLKLLMLQDNFKSSGSINDLSNELGYIYWYTYPCPCLPQSFQPHKLVELILCRSNIKQLWEDTKPLYNLKRLDLSHSGKLVKLQNFGEAINLKSLHLQGCIKLKQIDPTSGFPRNLIDLNLKDCKSLINLPHFRDAPNLKILNLQGCTKLRQIDPSIGCLKKLTHLNLKDCKSLVSLPNNMLELNSLHYLSLFGCSQLYKNKLSGEPRDAEHSMKLCMHEAPRNSQSSSSIFNMFITWLLPLYPRKQKYLVKWFLPSFSIMSSICQLDLSFCNLLQVPDAIGNLHWLERLCLRGNNFEVLPSLKNLSKLIHLNLQHCKQLENLPELPSQTSPNHLKQIPIAMFTNWQEYDEQGSGLNIFNCPELAKRESCSNMCYAWMMQIVKARYQYNHHDFYGIAWPPRITSIIPGSEIPSWFDSQDVCRGNSIRIDTSHVMDDSNWIGVACSAIFEVSKQRVMNPPKTERHFHDRIPLLFCEDLVTDELDHLWLFYVPQSDFISNCREGKELRLKIGGGEGYVVKVKGYGYRVVYSEDLQLTKSTVMHTQTSSTRKRKLIEFEEHK